MTPSSWAAKGRCKMMLVRIAYLVLIALALVACGKPAEPAVSATVHGKGMEQSSRFALSSADYNAHWSALGDCFNGLALRRDADGKLVEHIASGGVEGSDSGDTTVYGVKGGQFYVDAYSGCEWRVRFTPR